jgi:hypothetical protein
MMDMYMDSNEKDQGPDDWGVNMSKTFRFQTGWIDDGVM